MSPVVTGRGATTIRNISFRWRILFVSSFRCKPHTMRDIYKTRIFRTDGLLEVPQIRRNILYIF